MGISQSSVRRIAKHDLWLKIYKRLFVLYFRFTRTTSRVLVVSFDLQLSGYGSILTADHLQATLSKLLTYCVLRSTQPPTLSGTGNE